MSFLQIFKLFATILVKLSEYLKERKIREQIAKEAQDEIDKQVVIAQSARDDAYKLPESTDKNNRDGE